MMDNHSLITQELSSSYNELVFVIQGSVKIGDKIIRAEHFGWTGSADGLKVSELIFEACEDHAHFVL